ncbi:hypothetical protein [Streptomyces ipomoeae]|uniref:hypothetical protein n=1 Tax=Streptomyces ipomoeae TaxID=103232 RepID=UPI0011477AC3|nr:hypothetical protein [Streptomyces ipomoeae]MDX2935587.1 hypothetical protein [Streptomyces ipomoeae]TQE18396.1 hypothetical protein SipoB123_34160 [Streptomyces ipomoeae]
MNKQVAKRLIPLTLVGAVAATVATAAPASAANAYGCTSIQLNTGTLCVRWDALTNKYINTVEGDFVSSIAGVGNPRIHVRINDDQNRELWQNSRSWTGTRRYENATFEVTYLMSRPAVRVCATLYEGGGYMDTACSPIVI